MKTITLTVDVIVSINDEVEPGEINLHLSGYPVSPNGKARIGNILSYETTGFFEEETVGLCEFEEKPETD